MRLMMGIIFILFIFIAIQLDAINHQHYIIRVLKNKNKEILSQKDSISAFYNDMSNCIKEDFNLITKKKL